MNGDYNIWKNNSAHASTNPDEANSLYSQDFSTGMFTDYANADYTTLNADSNQVDAGTATYAPADDFIGTVRPQGDADDIGAYEYSGAKLPIFMNHYRRRR